MATVNNWSSDLGDQYVCLTWKKIPPAQNNGNTMIEARVSQKYEIGLESILEKPSPKIRLNFSLKHQTQNWKLVKHSVQVELNDKPSLLRKPLFVPPTL